MWTMCFALHIVGTPGVYLAVSTFPPNFCFLWFSIERFGSCMGRHSREDSIVQTNKDPNKT